MTAAQSVHGAPAALNNVLEGASPIEIVTEAIRSVARGRLAAVSSFGAESAVLLKLVADVDRSTPVIFLDTGSLFEETLAYRHRLTEWLGLTDVRVFAPSPSELAKQDPRRELWLTDPDACCRLRKIVPLAEALQPFDAWISGRKRYQGGERTRLPIVERDGQRLKFNPLARITRAEVERIFEAASLPRHPLQADGFSSVGCIPCTTRTSADEDPRIGRWRGLAKTECGIHTISEHQGRGDPNEEVEQQNRRKGRDAEAQQTLPDVFG